MPSSHRKKGNQREKWADFRMNEDHRSTEIEACDLIRENVKRVKVRRKKEIVMWVGRFIGKEINGGDYASGTSHQRLAITSKVFKGDAMGRTLAKFLM